jgi:hypothetical protein
MGAGNPSFPAHGVRQHSPAAWDGEEFEFQQWPFVRAKTVNFMHIPLNIGPVMQRTWKKIREAGAAPENGFLILSTDPSPWRGEHYFYVTRDVPDADMVRLSGRYLAKVFEGPYREAGKWARQMKDYVESQGKAMRTLYFFYTTCPRCARQFGKNYVVALAEV